MVGLEQTEYQVMEDEHSVKVCATVKNSDTDCAIEFPFQVNVVTTDSSAGKIFGRVLYNRAGWEMLEC